MILTSQQCTCPHSPICEGVLAEHTPCSINLVFYNSPLFSEVKKVMHSDATDEGHCHLPQQCNPVANYIFSM